MLRVTLEVVPYGVEERKRTIGKMTIGNISPDFFIGDETGDYKFKITDDSDVKVEMKFFDWPRRLGAWQLVQALLQLLHGPLPIEKTPFPGSGGRYDPDQEQTE